MNKYIRLENNTVVEVFTTTENIGEMFHESMGWSLCNIESIKVGDYLVDGKLLQHGKSNLDPVLERQWRDSELVRSDLELYKAQDSDPKSTGNVSDWRTYRKFLRAWPESEYFPNAEYRPKAPDVKE